MGDSGRIRTHNFLLTSIDVKCIKYQVYFMQNCDLYVYLDYEYCAVIILFLFELVIIPASTRGSTIL